MNNNICVLTAPFYKTGGTELCHQLVYAINSLGGNAEVLYKFAKDGKYINPAFKKYVVDYSVLDENFYNNFDGIVVIPESETLEISKFKKATIYLWWMSVDNYFKYQNLKYIYEEKKLLRTLKYLLTGYKFKKKYLPLNQMSRVTLHLAQSEYALDFLHKHDFKNVQYLSDYINEDYILKSDEMLAQKKENIILYNPNKGILYSKKIMKYVKGYKFIPLHNMSNEEMLKLMSKAKVYIDFGAHPGKDRMPREAALMGCCIITGKRGSAAFDDVAIPGKYKLSDKHDSYTKINIIITDIFLNYDSRINDFAEYRKKIKEEKQLFYTNAKEIFIENHNE